MDRPAREYPAQSVWTRQQRSPPTLGQGPLPSALHSPGRERRGGCHVPGLRRAAPPARHRALCPTLMPQATVSCPWALPLPRSTERGEGTRRARPQQGPPVPAGTIRVGSLSLVFQDPSLQPRMNTHGRTTSHGSPFGGRCPGT